MPDDWLLLESRFPRLWSSRDGGETVLPFDRKTPLEHLAAKVLALEERRSLAHTSQRLEAKVRVLAGQFLTHMNGAEVGGSRATCGLTAEHH